MCEYLNTTCIQTVQVSNWQPIPQSVCKFPQISRVEGTLFKPNIWEVELDRLWLNYKTKWELWNRKMWELYEAGLNSMKLPVSVNYLGTHSLSHIFAKREPAWWQSWSCKKFPKSCLGHSSSAGKGLMFTVLVWYALILLAPETNLRM